MSNSSNSSTISSKALQSVKSQFFKKNVHDIIRGVRAINPNGVGNSELSSQEKHFLNTCLAESYSEISSTDMNIKMNAIQKLVYLNMLGFDISSVQFCVVELMSSSKFHHKRVGYLAAIQSFSEDSEMILLATNQIKKDLVSQKSYEAELVLNALSVFMNADLAEILLDDILSLIGSSKMNVRRRAILLIYKIYLIDPSIILPHLEAVFNRTLSIKQDHWGGVF